MPANVRGAVVLPHVQTFADAVKDATGVSSFGTYPGHSPSIDRALDIFVPVNDPAQGNAVCAYALGNWNRFGLMYVIFRQRINSNDGRGWRAMEDRSVPGNPQQSLTNNHFDHVHVSFLAQAPNIEVEPEEDFLASLSDEEKAELFSRLRSIDDNTNDIGTRLFASLGGGNWETGAERLAHAVRLIEEMYAQHQTEE